MTERNCPVCNKIYLADPKRLKYGRQTTCSRACSYALRAQKLSDSVTLICDMCGTSFERSPAKLKRAKHGSFCSRACHYAARGVGIVRRVVEKPYVYTPQGKAAQRANSLKPKGQRVFHWMTCTQCGKRFDDPGDGRKRKGDAVFCSLDCCNTYRKGDKNPSWRGGHPLYYGPDWRPLRRAARERDDYTCRRCGLVCKPPARAPDVHHIIPISSFANVNDANTLDNVICLCQKCHKWCEWHGIDFAL